MTEEQKQRQRETYRRNRAAAEEKQHSREAEQRAQIDALRCVRDNPDADPGDVLRAVELLEKLAPKY